MQSKHFCLPIPIQIEGIPLSILTDVGNWGVMMTKEAKYISRKDKGEQMSLHSKFEEAYFGEKVEEQ